jgi:M-phase inducer tyrosine phosphatase
MHETMDISPLPHKLPFLSQIEIKSPTPTQTPGDDEMMLDSPAPLSRQTSLEPPKPIMTEYVLNAHHFSPVFFILTR